MAALPVSAIGIDEVTIATLRAQGARLVQHEKSDRITFIGSSATTPLTLSDTAILSPDTAANAALAAYAPLFGLQNPASETVLSKRTSGKDGRTSYRYQQTHQGIPVIGGELNINLSKDNRLLSMNGEVAPPPKLAVEAQINATQAVDTALAAVAKWHRVGRDQLSASAPELSIYEPQLLGPGSEPSRLVWRLEVRSTTLKPIRELVLIDAQRGNISLHFNQVHAARDRETYTANNSIDLPGTLVCDESDPDCTAGTATDNTDAVNAHLYAGDTYDFYFSHHGRDGIDNAGGTIISSVHWDDDDGDPATDDSSCPNAFWDGTQMVYCTDLVADDVVAHELTHGVTDRTSNLFYYYQSGAINESLSDLWGEFIDLTNEKGTDDDASRWLMGEDATAMGVIRNMADPTEYWHPDKMSSLYYWTESGDNGGVHTNSGVNNKAVYLMVDGGSFNGTTVTGLGIDKVAAIYYEVQTNLLTSAADYLDLYHALYQGCQNLVGTETITSADCDQVRAATEAVEMNQEPVANFTPQAAFCPEGTELSLPERFYDDLENGLGNWSLSNSNGYSWVELYATYDMPYATSGVESLFGANFDSISDQRASIAVTVPGGRPYLHFNHAFDFEVAPNTGAGYDGAVLEYSTDGRNWNDAASLIDAGQEYTGTIDATYGNPLGTRSAFTGSSNGYVSSRLNLASLARENAYFRWRVGTDNSVGALGWVIDDIRVYNCDSNGSLSFSNNNYLVNEGDGSITITVSRDGLSVGAVSVDYSTANATALSGSDYSATSGTLEWADGENADKTITVTITNDDSDEDYEAIFLTLSNPTGGATLGDVISARLTIDDDDESSSAGGGAMGWPLLMLLGLLHLLSHPFRRKE